LSTEHGWGKDTIVEKSSARPKRTLALGRFILPALLVGTVLVSYWLKIQPAQNPGGVASADSAAGLLARGIQAQNAGSFDVAMDFYRQVLKKEPGHHQAHYNIGQIYNARNQNTEARREYEAALKTDPNFLNARLNLGVMLYRERQFGAAADAFREVLRADPKHAQAQFNLGISLLELGQIKESIRWLTEALSQQPKQPSTHYYLGVALKRAGEPDKARAALEQAVNLDPRFAVAYQELAKVYESLGQRNLALEARARESELTSQQKAGGSKQ
jgi:tetratricopeptide (TPR) repeat protein